MNFKDAAYLILKQSGKPLSAKGLTFEAFQRELITSEGKTPERTMAAEIYKDINSKGSKSRFIKADKGLFGLAEWNENDFEGNQGIQTPKSVQEIIDKLRTTQLNSGKPSEFEEAIRDAFIFLGFEGELIGGSGDTDVLLTANIGEKSFKVSVDGKTSKSGRISDSQIDWISLTDHKQKNQSDFIVVVGSSFSGGNLRLRANQYEVSLLTTKALIDLISSHAFFPFTLTELRDLFSGKGDISAQIEDLLTQNQSRRNLIEQFRIIIEEMQSLQDRLGYFTFDSLAGREKLEELEIDPREIDYIIILLKLPFINGIHELDDDKYILVIGINDISNIFRQISSLLIRQEETDEIKVIKPVTIEAKKPKPERKTGSKYFRWYTSGYSVIAEARKEKPYKHHCPIEHFQTIIQTIIKAYSTNNLVNVDMIYSMLEDVGLAPDRPFKGRPEDYKIRMALGILEIEGLIKWTGSKRPIEYKLAVPTDRVNKWLSKINTE